MNTFLRFLQFFSLGAWVGSILYFGAVVAPGAFTVLTADQAGALVGISLRRLHMAGIVAGIIYLLATALLEKSALARPAPLLVLLMIVLTAVSQLWVVAPMDVLRLQMGSVSATPASDPARLSFDRLHVISVRLEMAVLLSGLVALLLTARRQA